MPRSVPEWVGRTPMTPIPPRVKLRIVERQAGLCAECGRPFRPRHLPEFDHRPALVNGGQNRETMIEAVGGGSCHRKRTRADVAEKKLVARKRKRRLGIAARKGRPMDGARASKWKRHMDGSITRRT